jgi:hypothetical protein
VAALNYCPISQKGKYTMKTIYTVPALAALAITMLIGPFAGGLTIQGNNTQAKLPPGKWSFSAGPYFGEGYKSMPVDVYSVTTRADKGLAVSRIAVRNRSPKPVTAIKLHWYLTNRDVRNVLLEGDTALIDLDLQPSENQILDFPVVTFSRVCRSLLNGLNLIGNYRIEIAVVEANYADTSIWTMTSADKISYRRVGYTRPTPVLACQNQGCVYIGTPGTESYTCGGTATKTFCSVGEGGQSCTETRCQDEIE